MVDGDAQLSPALPQSRAHLPVATQDEHRSKAAIATGDERPGFVRLAIKCPSLHQDPAVLSIRSSSSIRQVKAHIEQTWEGRPRVDGMRVIRAGRIVGDEEIVKDVIAGVSGLTQLWDAGNLEVTSDISRACRCRPTRTKPLRCTWSSARMPGQSRLREATMVHARPLALLMLGKRREGRLSAPMPPFWIRSSPRLTLAHPLQPRAPPLHRARQIATPLRKGQLRNSVLRHCLRPWSHLKVLL